MPTPAVAELDRAEVAYRLHEYSVEVGQGYGQAVAEAIGVEPSRVFKTLVAQVDDDPVVAVVPVTGRLSTKALARARGGKRASMADPGAVERLTGYVVGGVSPMGQRQRLALFVDESATSFPTMFVSGGKRGLEVELSPRDLLELTGGQTAPLT